MLKQSRAASGLAYGLLIGLMAIAALTVISDTGRRVDDLFCSAANAIRDTGDDCVVADGSDGTDGGSTPTPTASAEPTPPQDPGSLVVWGNNGNGQLASGSEGSFTTVPGAVQTAPAGVSFTAVSGGSGTFCAMTANGTLYCWGTNHYRQTGTGSAPGTNVASVLPFVDTSRSFDTISVGLNHGCGLDNGAAHCWGRSDYGEAGALTDSEGRDSLAPIPAPSRLIAGDRTLNGGALSFSLIEAGFQFTCGLSSEGHAYCWGRNDEGQLGTGDNLDTALPTPIAQVSISGTPQDLRFRALSLSDHHACGVTLDGDAYCWGTNTYGQLGNAATVGGTQNAPTLVPGGHSFTAVSTSSTHSCAITTGGDAYCWGRNQSGQLGDDNPTSSAVTTPQQAQFPPGVTPTQIGIASNYSCVVTSDDEAWCWGSGSAGRTGLGTTASFGTPQQLTDPDLAGGVIQLAVGASSVTALVAD